jgi:acyl dehydratase
VPDVYAADERLDSARGLCEALSGQTFSSPVREIDPDDFGLLCTLVGALSDLHMNAAVMRKSRFGERLLPGPLLAAVATGLNECCPEWQQVMAEFGVVSRATRSIKSRFVSAATPSSQISCQTRVTAVEEIRGGASGILVSLQDTLSSDGGSRILATSERKVAMGLVAALSTVTEPSAAAEADVHEIAAESPSLVAGSPLRKTPVGKRFQTYGRTLSAHEVRLLSDLTAYWTPAGPRVVHEAALAPPIVSAVGSTLAVYGSDLHRALVADCGVTIVAALTLGATFHRDVVVGDTLAAETWVDSVRDSSSRPGGGVMVIRDDLRNQSGDLVAKLSHRLLVSTDLLPENPI